MKKLLSILLCAALLATLTPSVFAATSGCMDIMSDKTWTFSENSDVQGFYGDLGNTTGNDKGTSTISVMPDKGLNGTGDHALVLNRVADSNNINMSFVRHNGNSNVTPSEFVVKFNFKTSATGTLFKYVFRNPNLTSNADYNALQLANGHIDFLGVRVKDSAYSKDVWYDVEMLFDIPKGFGELKFRQHGSSAWNTYRVVVNNGMLKGLTYTNRLAIGVQANTGEVCLDNYYQNNADVPAAFLGSDDFTDGVGGWTTQGGNMIATIYAQQVDVDGNKMLEIKADNAAEKKNTSARKDFPSYTTANAAADTNYYFRFKLGGNAAKGTIGASLQTNDGSANKEYFIARVLDNDLKLLGGLTDLNNSVDIPSTFGVPTETNLYEVEAVYNPSTSKMSIIVTNDKGVQFTVTTSQWSGTPNKFAFRHHVSEIGSTAVAHFDDFATDILDNNGPAIVSSDVLSGYASEASLDETAVFTYDRTIKQADLTDAVVTLNGQTLESDKYTITSKGTKVLVAVKDLEKGKPYTVGLSGVKDILGNASAAENEATVSFTTSDVDITATQPVLNGTVLSTNVTSYYAQGKTLKLIVAVYDETESMIEAVKVATITADDRNGETLSYDFAEVLPAEEGKVVKGFVWSGFDSMTPYAKAYK